MYFQNRPTPNQSEKYLTVKTHVSINDDFNTVINKMLDNAKNDAEILKILEFKRKYEESLRKNGRIIIDSDIASLLKKIANLSVRYIPKERFEDFLKELAELSQPNP